MLGTEEPEISSCSSEGMDREGGTEELEDSSGSDEGGKGSGSTMIETSKRRMKIDYDTVISL